MNKAIYNIGIRGMGAGIRFASLFNGKARKWARGRKKIFVRLRQALDPKSRYIWIHCASLGEFEQGRPIIEAIKQQQPGYKIILTFYSPSGYEIRRDYPLADAVFYLPLDTPANARRFIDIVKPEIAVFVKYEFWLNYLAELKNAGVRTFIVSAIFRRDSMFFKPSGGIFREALGTFETLFVQDEQSRVLLGGIGIHNVMVTGDTRFDRVAGIAAAAKHLPIVESFSKGNDVFVGGSTWPPDEELIWKALLCGEKGTVANTVVSGLRREQSASLSDLKIIIAPHETDSARIESLVCSCPAKCVRYTENPSAAELAEAKVLVIDTIGILSSVYRYARYGYIGGGFGRGIHNTLEAATFGLPLAFGPNYEKFREARELMAVGAARSVSTPAELENWLEGLMGTVSVASGAAPCDHSPTPYDVASGKAVEYVAANTGATNLFMETVFGK